LQSEKDVDIVDKMIEVNKQGGQSSVATLSNLLQNACDININQ